MNAPRTKTRNETDAKRNRKRNGFTLIEMVLCMTVMSVVGGVSCSVYKWVRAWQEKVNVADQGWRVIRGIMNYKDHYGVWPCLMKENGAPKTSRYGAVDYVFPVGNWFEFDRYANELPAVLSGENTLGCNPSGICFQTFSDAERSGEEVARFWLYFRGSDEEPQRAFNLWKAMTQKVDCPIDRIFGDEALFYVPKEDEILKWSPSACRRDG